VLKIDLKKLYTLREKMENKLEKGFNFFKNKKFFLVYLKKKRYKN